MKKYDEGYVLAYVTVVLLVFCLVATMILTGALRNLQTQQNINEQTKSQYLAAGEIEKVIASLDALKKGDTTSVVISCSDTIQAEWNDSSKLLTLTASYGMVVVVCDLSMENASVTQVKSGEAVVSVTITGFSAYTYDSYEIGGISE